MTNLRKMGYNVSMSWEMFYSEISERDPRYARKEKSRTLTPPTEEEWADYRKACEALDFLQTYPGFEDGYDSSFVLEPQPRVEIEFAETVDEWLKRCRKMDGRDG